MFGSRGLYWPNGSNVSQVAARRGRAHVLERRSAERCPAPLDPGIHYATSFLEVLMSLLSSLRPLVLGLGLGAIAACGGSSQGPAKEPTPPTTTAQGDPHCPVEVPGTSVSVEDTATGAAIVFVTTSDVTELRKRVADVAKMHNDHHGAMGALPDGTEAGGGHAHHHGGHDMSAMGSEHAGHTMPAGGEHAGHDMGGGGLSAMISVHSKAAAEDIEGGAKIVFTSFPDDVANLQSELRMHAEHLSSGTCAMGHH